MSPKRAWRATFHPVYDGAQRRDRTIDVLLAEGRRIEVLANSRPMHQGRPHPREAGDGPSAQHRCCMLCQCSKAEAARDILGTYRNSFFFFPRTFLRLRR